MSGTFIGKRLASGNIGSATTTTIYTVPAATKCYLKSVLVSSAAGAGTSAGVRLLINDGTADRVCSPNAAVAANASSQLCDITGLTLILNAGDVVKIQTAASTSGVDYIASGVEET